MQCSVVASLSLAPWKNCVMIAGYCLPLERRAVRLSLLPCPQGWFWGLLLLRSIDCFYERERRGMGKQAARVSVEKDQVKN